MSDKLEKARKIVEHAKKQTIYQSATSEQYYRAFDCPSAVNVAIAETLLEIHQQNKKIITLLTWSASGNLKGTPVLFRELKKMAGEDYLPLGE